MDTSTAPQPVASSQGESKSELIRGLTLLDSVLLLVSGIIGSSIFLTAKDIAGPLPHPAWFLLVWVLGGVVSLMACFAFAELGSMFPDSGGQYVYLREAFGDLPAFLYGWMLFTVGNGGTIAALSVASAAYLGGVFPGWGLEQAVLTMPHLILTRAHLLALFFILAVTWINVCGLRSGALLQNIATWAKFAAMGAFVLLGFAIGRGSWSHITAPPPGGLNLATTQQLAHQRPGPHPGQDLVVFRPEHAAPPHHRTGPAPDRPLIVLPAFHRLTA